MTREPKVPSEAAPIFSLTVAEAVDRIRAVNPTVNAYVSTRLDDAMVEAFAGAVEAPRSSLHGVPFGLKDEWETLCLPTTGGSWRHRDRRSSRDGEVYRTFADAGAVLVGKSNLSDMGLAAEASNYLVGASRNPWDVSRTAGGSSGGAAAAVAAGMQSFDWGTDIGGSIRQPAAFCGVFGLRLSSETWPILASFPSVPATLGWMCGQGPLTRTTAQMRAVLAAAAGRLRIGAACGFHLTGAVVYAPPPLGDWPTFEQDVRPHLEAAFDGGVRTDHGLPDGARMRSVYSAVWASHLEQLVEADPTLTLGTGLLATASALLFRGRLGDRRVHPDCAAILALIALGRVTLYRDGERALREAMAIRDLFSALWARGLIVVSPVSTGPAPVVGRGNRDHARVICWTGPGNLADATGLSIPFGRFGHLPRALQLMGPPGSEALLLDLADRLIASRDRVDDLRPRPWPMDARRG